MKVVGHGPVPSHSPYVPDFLLVEEDGVEVLVTRAGRRPGLPDARKAGRCSPHQLEEGWWPLVSLSGRGLSGHVSASFQLSDETKWRAQKARDLLESTKSMQGRPEEVLVTVKAASSLVDFDVEKAAREASVVAAPGESLADAFARTRRGG